MPVKKNSYSHRGGGNYGVVLRCQNLVARRLVYFDHNPRTGSWVIRDFIFGQRLSNNLSPLTVSQIEGDADYDEFPAWCNVEVNAGDWAAYLRLRTTAAFRPRRSPDSSPPNPGSGRWQPL